MRSHFHGDFFEAVGSSGSRPVSGGSSSRPSSSGSSAARRPTTATRPVSGGGPSSSSGTRPQPRPSGTPTAPRPSAGSGGARPRPRPSGGLSLSSFTSGLERLTSYAQQAWDFAQAGVKGYHAAQQFAASLGIGGRPAAGAPPPAPAPAPAPAVAPAPVEPPQPSPGLFAPAYDAGATPQPQIPAPAVAGGDQIAALLQALQQRQIPALPGITPQSGVMQSAALPTRGTPIGPAAPQQPSALALLATILTNPQLQQALHAGPARSVQLPVPTAAAPGQSRSVPIPLSAVLSAALSLAGQSMTELAEAGEEESDDVPLYVLGDDGYVLVDPRNADDRAALVAYLFRLNEAARDAGRYSQFDDDGASWASSSGIR